jgi:hypothetical protein
MGGGLPCVVGEPDLVAPCAKLRRCCADHGVVGEAEERKGDHKTNGYEDGRLDYFLHIPLLALKVVGVVLLF